MAELNPKNEEPEKERRFSQKQYDMLKRCSDKKDMTEWNKWRKYNPDEDILLEGADFNCAHLEDTDLSGAHLQGAYFIDAHLERAKLNMANMGSTTLRRANMRGANLNSAKLQGAGFLLAIVDGSTLIWYCKVNRYCKGSYTDFRGVGLDSARIDPGTKQLLEYNIRRLNWEEWYPKHRALRWPVRGFWEISDYGISTKQIIKTFLQWALIFAAVYLAWGLIDYHLVGLKDDPGIVSNLFVLEDKREAVSRWLVPFRAIYFSIVTMTTLGFGDMYANAHGFLRGLFGHALLALQVILGYVLLGALVTRFAVLFTAGGPAGKFSGELTLKQRLFGKRTFIQWLFGENPKGNQEQ